MDRRKSDVLLWWCFVFAIHLSAAVLIFRDVVEPWGTAVDRLIGLGITFMVVLFCRLDAQLLGKPLLSISQLIMLFTWPVTAPLYCLSRRGWRGLGWLALWLFTLLLAACSGFFLGQIVLLESQL